MQRVTPEKILPEGSPSVVPVWHDDEPVDQTPPPDHEGWLEACESGWRFTRERREKRRRKPASD